MWAHGNNCTMVEKWLQGGVYLLQVDGLVVYSVDGSIGMYYIGYLCQKQ
jgi:hypothetical protein